MAKFICTSEAKDALDYRNKKIGVTEKRALFYSSSSVRNRIYRRDMKSRGPRMKLFTFTKKESAQSLCDRINETYNDDFKVEEL